MKELIVDYKADQCEGVFDARGVGGRCSVVMGRAGNAGPMTKRKKCLSS